MFVQTQKLAKAYGRVHALVDFTFGVGQGEVFGLLGPNGAGKTTLLRLLMGFLRPTAGRATIDGLDSYRQAVEAHRKVAYLPGDVRLFRQMRGRGVLEFFVGARGQRDPRTARELAERLELDLSRRVAYMSTGMRQKLALAVTLSADVPLLILDEPTSNLDPNMRREVTTLVRDARRQGRTVLFSSHVISEVEQVCDRVAVLRQGQLVAQQTMSELRCQHRIRAVLKGEMPEVPEAFRHALTITMRNDRHVTIDTPAELAPILSWLATLPLEEIGIEPIGLRRVYDRYHRRQPAVTAPLAGPTEP